jgi:hypothetical protein
MTAEMRFLTTSVENSPTSTGGEMNQHILFLLAI